jgi:hypothetical protein
MTLLGICGQIYRVSGLILALSRGFHGNLLISFFVLMYRFKKSVAI